MARGRLLFSLIAMSGVVVPASAASRISKVSAGPPVVRPGAPCSGGPGCTVLPPPTGRYRDTRRSVGVAFTLAKRHGSSALVIRDFQIANACTHGTTHVTPEISVGPSYQFRLSSTAGITIRGSFRAVFTGDFGREEGLARGTVHFRSAHCSGRAITFHAVS